MQEFKEVPVEFNQIKIGDWVRLENWEDFYEVGFVMPDVIKVKYFNDLASYGVHILGQWYKKEEIVKDSNNCADELKDNNQQQDKTTQEPLFKVGDVVWCLVFGKGIVSEICDTHAHYLVEVRFEDGSSDTYTEDGRLLKSGKRTLFFSEPKVEALTERPFQSKLIGKTVVLEVQGQRRIELVYGEDANYIYTQPEGKLGGDWKKKNLDAVYEISSENLLVKG